MGKHDFHDRQSPGDDSGPPEPDPGAVPDPLTQTAAPASLSGVTPGADWVDDGVETPPVDGPVVTGTIDPDTGQVADLRVERPYIDRPGRLYMSGTYNPQSGEVEAAPPGSPAGVIPDPDRPADLDPPGALLGVATVELPPDAHAGPDVTDRHDPGDPEQYAGAPVGDGWGDGRG